MLWHELNFSFSFFSLHPPIVFLTATNPTHIRPPIHPNRLDYKEINGHEKITAHTHLQAFKAWNVWLLSPNSRFLCHFRNAHTCPLSLSLVFVISCFVLPLNGLKLFFGNGILNRRFLLPRIAFQRKQFLIKGKIKKKHTHSSSSFAQHNNYFYGIHFVQSNWVLCRFLLSLSLSRTELACVSVFARTCIYTLLLTECNIHTVLNYVSS